MPLDYTFSISGPLLWLMVVVILATLASLLPAWRAAGSPGIRVIANLMDLDADHSERLGAPPSSGMKLRMCNRSNNSILNPQDY